MPLYEYECECGHRFERLVTLHARPGTCEPKRCPECDGWAKRVISKTNFRLKGSGWYGSDEGTSKTETGDGD